MSIIFQLSSQRKEKSEQGNRFVSALIQQNPEFLSEIINCLNSENYALLGDCVEVCTMLSEGDPALIAPYSDKIIALVQHKNTRVRWEAMHTIALLAPLIPDLVFSVWEEMEKQFFSEKSVIVRDYIVVCAGNLAKSGMQYAEKIYPFLITALSAYQTHHAKLVLEGLKKSISNLSGYLDEMSEIVEIYLQHPKPSIRKAALQLQKSIPR